MRLIHRAAWLWLVAYVVLFPVMMTAQRGSDRARPGVPTTDQQKSGEALFYQRCPLCHVYTARTAAARSRTELVGFYKQPSVTDEAVRQLIMEGIPGRMPSFKYTFTLKELDDLVAYLKVR